MSRQEGNVRERELAFQVADRYIYIQESEEGYDYSILGEDYKLLDGGLYENPDSGIWEALYDILVELKEYPMGKGVRGNIDDDHALIRIDCEILLEKMEEANRIKGNGN